MSAQREPLFTRPFLIAFAAHFLHAVSYNLFLHLPGWLGRLGADEARIGLVMGVAGATALLARPALGRAIDERGRRPVAIAGGVLGVIACASYLLAGGIGPVLYVVRLAHGLSEAMLFASLFALVADVVPASRRIEGLGLFGVSGLLPIALGGLIGDAVVLHRSYEALFMVAAGCSLFGTLLSLALPETRTVSAEPTRGILGALFQRNLMPLWACGLFLAMALAAPFTFLKTLVLERPELGQVGPFFGAYTAGAVAVRILGGRIPERVGPERAFAPAVALMSAGFVLIALTHSPGFLVGCGHGFAFPILTGLVVARAPARDRGAALSVYTGLFDAGLLIGAPICGAVARGAGHGPMFATMVAITLLAVAIFFVWDPRPVR
jgi:MFS family permease